MSEHEELKSLLEKALEKLDGIERRLDALEKPRAPVYPYSPVMPQFPEFPEQPVYPPYREYPTITWHGTGGPASSR